MFQVRDDGGLDQNDISRRDKTEGNKDARMQVVEQTGFIERNVKNERN